jgi:stress-induced morphogen
VLGYKEQHPATSALESCFAVLQTAYGEFAKFANHVLCIVEEYEKRQFITTFGFPRRISVTSKTQRRLIFCIGGCGQMYEAIIVSPQFTKKTTLARHRLVNSTLKDEIAAIHAWTPKCHTPEEWEKKKPQ